MQDECRKHLALHSLGYSSFLILNLIPGDVQLCFLYPSIYSSFIQTVLLSGSFVISSFDLFWVYVVQINIWGGHTAEAQFLGEQGDFIEHFPKEGWSRRGR